MEPLELQISRRPYYLRGDFDGDGIPDYAVVVRGRATKRDGVLVCTGRGKSFIVGAVNPIEKPFSDMPGDRFVAPTWMVYSKQETLSLRNWKVNVPSPIPPIRGETIALIWEDGIALLYWTGTGFKWAPPKD